MEKIKKFVKKKSNTFNCGVRLYCRTYSSIFCRRQRSENKFKLHQLPPRYRQQMQTQKQLLCLQQRKPLKVLPIPLNQTKIKRTEKIPKIKRTVRIIRRTVTVQPLKKSEKSEQSSSNSSSDKKKTVFFIKGEYTVIEVFT